MKTVSLCTVQGHTAEVYLHGAHLVSWKMPDAQELLFVSKKAVFAPPKAIRGGVPVCFPQFGMLGPMAAQHGFARNSEFEVESEEKWTLEDGREGVWKVTMVLRYDGSRAEYPHAFVLRIITMLCHDVLIQDMEVENSGGAPLAFTGALHTYYRVGQIQQVAITGLEHCKYLDNLRDHTLCEASCSLLFTEEVDRVYLGVAAHPIQLFDKSSKRMLELTLENFPDAVVWNPWVEKARALADFEDEEYQECVCIEPAVAGSGAVTLAPGTRWKGRQAIRYSALI